MLCLKRETDPAWVDVAVGDVCGVLADHAHCEMKAASTALSLAARYPSFTSVVIAMVALAEEEIGHFKMVFDELSRRGGALVRPPPDAYASELRRRAFATATETNVRGQLVDRLLVAALIEARSCERFKLLADALASRGEPALAELYGGLLAAEARHYRMFVDLAREVASGESTKRAASVDERLAVLAEEEGRIVADLGVTPQVHG